MRTWNRSANPRWSRLYESKSFYVLRSRFSRGWRRLPAGEKSRGGGRLFRSILFIVALCKAASEQHVLSISSIPRHM